MLAVWRWSNALGYLVLTLVLCLPVAVALFHGAGRAWAALPLLGPLLYTITAYTLKMEWESWTFRLGPDTLEMSHGWLFRKRRVVARGRIQHLDVNSGPFDRRFGLVQVVVYTAGTTVGMIPGLSPARAERLREEIFGVALP